jgi:hypothetical protein
MYRAQAADVNHRYPQCPRALLEQFRVAANRLSESDPSPQRVEEALTAAATTKGNGGSGPLAGTVGGGNSGSGAGAGVVSGGASSGSTFLTATELTASAAAAAAIARAAPRVGPVALLERELLSAAARANGGDRVDQASLSARRSVAAAKASFATPSVAALPPSPQQLPGNAGASVHYRGGGVGSHMDRRDGAVRAAPGAFRPHTVAPISSTSATGAAASAIRDPNAPGGMSLGAPPSVELRLTDLTHATQSGYSSLLVQLRRTRPVVEAMAQEHSTVQAIAALGGTPDFRNVVTRMFANPVDADRISSDEYYRRQKEWEGDRAAAAAAEASSPYQRLPPV